MSKKVFYLVLITIILLSLIVRYPTGEHESASSDSLDYHGKSVSVVENGHYKLYNNTLSFFGWYPYSNPSGGTFWYSSFPIVTDLSMEQSAIIISFTTAIIGLLNILLFSHSLNQDRRLVLLVVLTFNFSATVIDFSTWILTYRGLLLVFFPIALYTFVNIISRKNTIRNIILSSIFMICLLAIHRASVFSIGIISILFIINFIYSRSKAYRLFLLSRLNTYVSSVTALITITTIYFLYFGTIYEVGQNQANNVKDFMIFVYDLLISYSMSLGIVIIFTPIGLFHIIRKSLFQEKYLFFVMTLFTYIPFSYDLSYAVLYFHVLLIYMSSLGIFNLSKLIFKTEDYQTRMVVLILVISSTVPYLVTINPTETIGVSEDIEIKRGIVYPETYNCAIFLRYNHEQGEASFTNIPVYSSSITAFSGTKNYNFPSYLADEYLEPIPITDLLTGNFDSILIEDYSGLLGSDSGLFWNVLNFPAEWDNPMVKLSIKKNLNSEGPYYFVSGTFMEGKLLSNGDYIESIFISSVTYSFFEIYADSMHEVYYLSYV